MLRRLSQLGDKLIVGISSDEFNRLQGKVIIFSYSERASNFLSSKYVDDVFP
ncbi:adenylyltransferase/cytidyltransferase family protein [Vibrio lentus]|nr:adenylyltransferase/cytidyltransferase family protein [Vibrio lentus]